jgi:hypothetical protein
MKPLAHDQEVSETNRQSNAKVSRAPHCGTVSSLLGRFPGSLRLDKAAAELTLTTEVSGMYAL